MITLYFERGETLQYACDSFVGLDFSAANLHRAIFQGLDVSNASFANANLRNAIFDFAILNSSNMSNAALMNAALTCAEMEGVDLSGANAVGAVFAGANLAMSNLKSVGVRGACFKGANLCGAYFVVEHIEESDLSGSKYDSETVWPSGFNPVVHGAIKI